VDQREPEIDARFLLANERTVLAWTRTALALVAGGVAINQFGSKVAGQTLLSVLLILAGAAGGLIGARRYAVADRSIRRGELPPRGFAPEVVSVGVAVIALALLVAILADVLE
jgi:putative membrane protein